MYAMHRAVRIQSCCAQRRGRMSRGSRRGTRTQFGTPTPTGRCAVCGTRSPAAAAPQCRCRHASLSYRSVARTDVPDSCAPLASSTAPQRPQERWCRKQMIVFCMTSWLVPWQPSGLSSQHARRWWRRLHRQSTSSQQAALAAGTPAAPRSTRTARAVSTGRAHSCGSTSKARVTSRW